MTPEQEIYKSNRAREVLENEEYIAAFEAIQTEIKDQWMQSPARDQEGRERLWLMLKMLGKVELCLQQTMESGKLAVANLEHKQNLYDKARGWLKSVDSDAL